MNVLTSGLSRIVHNITQTIPPPHISLANELPCKEYIKHPEHSSFEYYYQKLKTQACSTSDASILPDSIDVDEVSPIDGLISDLTASIIQNKGRKSQKKKVVDPYSQKSGLHAHLHTMYAISSQIREIRKKMFEIMNQYWPINHLEGKQVSSSRSTMHKHVQLKVQWSISCYTHLLVLPPSIKLVSKHLLPYKALQKRRKR
jgi:hypothetical protein